jgi:hypothetical protein
LGVAAISGTSIAVVTNNGSIDTPCVDVARFISAGIVVIASYGSVSATSRRGTTISRASIAVIAIYGSKVAARGGVASGVGAKTLSITASSIGVRNNTSGHTTGASLASIGSAGTAALTISLANTTPIEPRARNGNSCAKLEDRSSGVAFVKEEI